MTAPHKPTRTYSCVALHKCRHPDHVNARRRYNKAGEVRRLTGRGRYIPVEGTRAAITRLKDAGYTLSDIDRATGIHHTTLSRIDLGIHKRVIVGTARAIARMERNSDRMFVPVDGTIRRLEALALEGFSAKFVCKRVGLHATSVQPAKSKGRRIHGEIADKIAEAFNELWGKNPLDYGATKQSVNLTKAVARKYGYVPALAWDDIDDPNETPKGVAA